MLTYWASKHADVVAVSSDLYSSTCTATIGSKQCQTIPNGVDLYRIPSRSETGLWRRTLGLTDRQFVVGNIARFDQIKRQKDLVEAVQILKGESAEIIFVLVGQGSTLSEVRELARGCSNIRFVPKITDVAPFLRCLDVFVLCSDDEGTPIVLLEAMACGCPIVATAVGGVPNLMNIESGAPCAELVPPRNPLALAAAINKLRQDPELRATLRARAMERALTYSFDTEWIGYSKLYHNQVSVN